jgi:hypothetical protein
MAADSDWNSVVLHAPLNSIAAGITDVKGKTITVAGGATLTLDQGRFSGEASLYFDGTDDRVTLASTSDFDFSAGVVTYRFSIRPVALPASGKTCRIIMVGTNGSSTGQNIAITGDGTIYIGKPVGSTNSTGSAAGTITTGVWQDIEVVVSNATTVRIFKNGALVAGPGSLTLQSAGANVLAIGQDNSVDPVDKWYNGYFSHLQITKAVERHTAAFSQITAPHARPEIKGLVTGDSSEPLARRIVAFNRKTLVKTGETTSDPVTGGSYVIPYSNYTDKHFVCRLDNDVVFASRLSASGFPTLTGQTLTTIGGVTASTAIADPFGGSSASALFTGAGSRLSTTSDAEFLPGTLYTIRGWGYVDSLPGVATGLLFIGTIGSGSDRTQIIINDATGSINFYSQGASSVFNITSANGVITTGNWFYFEGVRDGVEAFLFVNGTQVAYGLASGTETTGQQLHLGYGLTSSTDRGLLGRLFDVQFSRRVEHRTAYTPPTTLLPDDGSKVAWIYDSVTAG